MKARDAFRECHAPAPEPTDTPVDSMRTAWTIRGIVSTLTLMLVFVLGSGASSLLPDRSAQADLAAAQRNDALRQQLIDQAAYRKALRQAHDQGMREVLDALTSDARGQAFAQACMALQQPVSEVRP